MYLCLFFVSFFKIMYRVFVSVIPYGSFWAFTACYDLCWLVVVNVIYIFIMHTIIMNTIMKMKNDYEYCVINMGMVIIST